MKKWIGLDGEGIGRNPHRYVMMARSDREGNSSVIENKHGLKTAQCLDWLLLAPANARLCGYYLGYDWTMVLRDMPNSAIYRLLRPELRLLPNDEGGGFSVVCWNNYRLHYLAGMMRIKRGNRSVIIWDLGKFFQAPFVDAIEAWEVLAPLTDIRAMKDKRATFKPSDHESIRAYCISECRALAELATKLQEAHEAAGLHLKSYFGPGSTASALMKTLGIADKRGQIPSEVEHIADLSFFGGRFEHSMIGVREDVFGYDLVNAYVYEAYKLPCLQHGRWERVKREKELTKGVHACVRYTLQDIGDREVWGPLPCRLGNGTIVFPRSGSSGWVWLDEYIVASREWSGVKFGGEAWILRKECDCQPFADLLPLFRIRVELGKSGKGRIVKLALVSTYGKMAQTVGVPQYASRPWAGMITSGTRAQLLRMIARHKDRRSVLSLATDGFYSTERIPLPAQPLHPDSLGAWESKYEGEMVFIRPGIYWSEEGSVRTRGIGRRLLDPKKGDSEHAVRVMQQREAVLDAIDSDDESVVVGESDLFGGARACVYKVGDKLRRSKHYGQWHTIPARVSLDPRPKRRTDWSLHMLPGIESAPYSRAPLSDDAKAMKVLGDVFWGMR